MILGVIILGITYSLYKNRCLKCKSFFTIMEDEDKKENLKISEEKTTYYSKYRIIEDESGNEEKEYFDSKPITIKYEINKHFFHCKNCKNETSTKLRNDLTPIPEAIEIKGNYKKSIKKQIPKILKTQLWEKYFKGKTNGKCYCCKKNITAHHFEAGHVKAEKFGGAT
jgi:hypothetical protein